MENKSNWGNAEYYLPTCWFLCVHAQLLSFVYLFETPWSLLGSSLHEIFQTGILEWVAISFSRESSQARDQTGVSWVSCIGKQILHHYAISLKRSITIHTSLFEWLLNEWNEFNILNHPWLFVFLYQIFLLKIFLLYKQVIFLITWSF